MRSPVDACFLPVFLEPKTISQEEAKAFKKYAGLMRLNLRNVDPDSGFYGWFPLVCFCHLLFPFMGIKPQGAYPFEMNSAAKELEDIANGVVSHEPLADVSWSDS